MDDMMKKMLMKKKDSSQMSDEAKEAKMEVLMELLQMAQDAMGSQVKSGMDEMQKVSVMAPDKESLSEGLEMAQEVLPEVEEASEESEIPAAPSEELEMAKDEDESEENMFSKREPKEKVKKSLFSMNDEDEE